MLPRLNLVAIAVPVLSSIVLSLFAVLAQPQPGLADTESMPPGVARSPKASLFLIGGAADSTLSDFIRIAEQLSGKEANIAVITLASSTPAETGDELQNSLTALGVKHTSAILPGSKDGLAPGCNAIYFCGGDQSRLKRLIKEPLLGQLSTFEGLIGGSSAGAMIAAPKMIAGGMDHGSVKAGELLTIDGLGFLPRCIVDTHVGQRSRDTRSLAALALIPEAELSIALDEDTAVFIKAGKARVYGPGNVRLFRRAPGFSSDIAQAKRGQMANVKNVTMSALSEGDEFDVPASR